MSGVVEPLPSCGLDHCITCGDEATPMRVLALDADTALAECAPADGPGSTVDVGLIDALAVGDAVLVHAGVALQRLEVAT